jgi:streptomycin 6-kinase
MSFAAPRARPDVIPAPPDRVLTALATALSASAMEPVIAEALGDRVAVRACIPAYIRYKPETSCIVQYRLTAEDAETGRRHELGAYVKLFAGDRAGRVWAKGTAQRLAATAAEWSDDEPPVERAAYLPELGALLQVFPVDTALSALAQAAGAAGRKAILARLLPGSPPGEGAVETVRYKPARKALLRYEAPGHPVYVKLYAHEGAELLFRAARSLGAAGVPIVSPLGCLPDLQLLAQVEEPGSPLHALYGTDEYEDGARAAGEALARLHAAEPPAGIPTYSAAHQAETLAASAQTIGALRPDLRAEAAAQGERAIELLRELPVATAALHGDFYDDQVLQGERGARLLDLDGIRLGHPLVDVGNFLAHLTVRDPDDRARAAFLDGYGADPSPALALMEASALLRLTVTPFRHLEPDWPAGLERRLALVAHRLAEAGPPLLRPPERRLDPALPQLAVLRDPAFARVPLAEALGMPVRVTHVVVVRHKRGRRCTLRYTVIPEEGGEPTHVYAKTFASGRGPGVFRSLRALADGWARDGGIVIPEPVGYARTCKLLLQRKVSGEPARPCFLAGDRELAARVAEALASLHTSPVRLERRHRLDDELSVLRARVERLGDARERARRCLARLEAALADTRTWRERPVHRDIYHDQLLVDGDTLAILDLDDAASSEPAVDVANFLAHLRLLSIEEPGRSEAVETVAETFRERAHELDPELDPKLVCLLESATILRLACIHDLHAERLLAEAEGLLPRAGDERPGRRPARSRLELALDGPRVLALVAEPIEAWAGARPTECRPVLLRHKKGSAVVRYDLLTPSEPLTVVGKWFGVEGGSGEVAEILSALRRDGFSGPELAVPEPIVHVGDLNLLVTDFAAGPSLRSLLETNPRAAERAGAWLARFHTSDVRLARSRPPAAAARLVHEWGERGDLPASLVPRVAAALQALPDPDRPSHDDFSTADVLVPKHGPTVVVDFDDAARGNPGFDVAHFEATLRLRGWRGLAEPRAVAAATTAFRNGYEREAPLPDVPSAVRAAVWLRLAARTRTRLVAADIYRFALERAAGCLEGEAGP